MKTSKITDQQLNCLCEEYGYKAKLCEQNFFTLVAEAKKRNLNLDEIEDKVRELSNKL